MLKVSRPRLCQQCHNASYHPSQPRSDGLTPVNGAVVVNDRQFIMGRQCQNCHFNIHGSNHPSGKAFTR